jgi:hypothetical protein
MDCAGRAQRRRRFRTHHDPVNLPPGSCAQSGVALRLPPHSKHARRIHTPYGLRRQSAAATALSRAPRSLETPTQVARSKAVSRSACHRTPKRARRTHTPYGLRRQSAASTALSHAPRSRGTSHPARALESGVALRLPPHSKTRSANPYALWTAVTCHRFRCTARTVLACPCPAFGAFSTCSQSGVVPPHSKHTPGESKRPMDCAGRAQRRRRFRTHHDPGKLPHGSRAPKRCRASLATALQNTLGRTHTPYGLR